MVNLYSKTRGINRFKGLAKTFELLSEDGFWEKEKILSFTYDRYIRNKAMEGVSEKGAPSYFTLKSLVLGSINIKIAHEYCV